jgi:hypothetical protein
VKTGPFPECPPFVTNTNIALTEVDCYVCRHMNSKFLFALVALFSATAWAVEKTAYTLTPMTNTTATTTNTTVVIRFTNNFSIPNGVSTLEGQSGRKWVALQNFFTTQNIGSVELPLPSGYSNYRLVAMSTVPGNIRSRLALAYGNISTEGGHGPVPAGTNLWIPEYEGAPATNVLFSNPRAAVADEAGRIYVVERDSHAVSVIDTGLVHTAVGGAIDRPGYREAGFVELESAAQIPATLLPLLNSPSGLYYQSGTLYILDAGNGRVLRYRNGLVSKLFSEATFGSTVHLTNAGSLWVSPDEQEAFYTDGTVLKHWEASKQTVQVEASGLVDLADVKVDPRGRTIVVDQGANRLYRVRGNGSFLGDPVAGNGLVRGLTIGDARRVALAGPSSLAYLPIGGYFISTDAGAQVWYVDIDGDIAPFIFGRAPTEKKAGAHAGDGQWFRRGGRAPKVSNVQSINVAPNGDLILLEGGYVRKIKFLRSKP